MSDNYLIIHKSVLPDYYEKVLKARRLLESGRVREVSEAVRRVGISRSTYYKYKDYLFEPTDIAGERKAVLSMMLDHTPGVLSALLRCISDAGASVLTITQSLPIHDMASVTLSLDLSGMTVQIAELIETIAATPGVDKVRLLAVE